MEKLLITGGCSFSAHSAKKHLAWPWHFRGLYSKDGYWVENTAEMAAGNGLIYRNLIAGIQRHKKTYKDIAVAVMWSNPNRFELLIDRETNGFNSMYKDFFDSSNFSNQILNNGHAATHQVSNWLKSGGGFGHWHHDNMYADLLHKNYLKYIHSDKLQFLKTVENIVHLQQYCELYKIPLINFTWENIFQGTNDIHGSNVEDDKSEFELCIESVPTARHLWEMVNWDNWWFYGKYGGLKEYCINSGFSYENGNHPCTNCQLTFAQEVVKKEVDRVWEKVVK